MKKISILSFFSGSGFLDLGFENNGFEVTYVNEYFAPFLDAYKYSREQLNIKKPRYEYFCGSIEECLNGSETAKIMKIIELERKAESLVGFIGGPPCPDFSIAGKNKGGEGENGKLSKTYFELICKAKPDFFIFENVKGLWKTAKHRAFYEDIKLMLIENNYAITDSVVNSLSYGVAQDRERIFLFGVNKKLLKNQCISEFIWQQNNNQLDKKFPPNNLTIQYWFNKNDVNNHPNSKHFFKPRAALPKFIEIKEGDVSKKSFKRLSRYKWSPTAAYGNNEVHIHPTEPRRISVAEALSIQSLPKEFCLPSEMTLTNMFKTIGNGVPYLMASGIAISIKSFLDGLSYENNSSKLSKSNK